MKAPIGPMDEPLTVSQCLTMIRGLEEMLRREWRYFPRQKWPHIQARIDELLAYVKATQS